MQTRKGIKPTTESAGSVQFGQSYSSSMDWFQSDLTFRFVQFSSLYPKLGLILACSIFGSITISDVNLCQSANISNAPK